MSWGNNSFIRRPVVVAIDWNIISQRFVLATREWLIRLLLRRHMGRIVGFECHRHSDVDECANSRDRILWEWKKQTRLAEVNTRLPQIVVGAANL